jgi:putative oxidoreductase
MRVISSQVVAGEDKAAALRLRLRVRRQVYVRDITIPLPREGAQEWHNHLLSLLHRRSVPALRLVLGLIFLWFGVLKLIDASPVMEILKHTYSFLPLKPFALTLGGWEVLVGIGLLVKRALRCTLALLCVHLAGTFAALLLGPTLFFHHGNPLWLTVEGEFVMKNMVLVAAGLVIAGHEIEPLGGREKSGAYQINIAEREEASLASR